jgi:hypothetical protein
MRLGNSVLVGLAVAASQDWRRRMNDPWSLSSSRHRAVRLVHPANAFLNEMSKGRSDVLPLAFHVTYWDRLGWKDPFSLEAATERQDRYGRRLGDGSYTPEMVVDGSVGLRPGQRSNYTGQAVAAELTQRKR